MSEINTKFVFSKTAAEYQPKKTNQIQQQKVVVEDKVKVVNTEMLNLNLNANEYKPKKEAIVKEGYAISNDDFDSDDDVKDKDKRDPPKVDNKYNNEVKISKIPNKEEDTGLDLDFLIEQGLDNFDEDDENYENEWLPKFKDCACCKGYVNKCKGDICSSLGVCYCKAQEEFDPEMMK